MKKIMSTAFAILFVFSLSVSAFADSPPSDENIMPLSRGNYYLTSGYSTIQNVSTGIGTSSIEVHNAAENGAGIWVRIGSNEQGIHMGGTAAWTVGWGTHSVQAKIGNGPIGTYTIEINVAT